jgi:UDP-glucose 4-epimerase
VRTFLAGASGVIGTRMVPLLAADGHVVAGMTRSPAKAEELRTAGAEPVVCDVYDEATLIDAVTSFGPEMVMHQLTDLPDSVEQLSEFWARNDRIRTEGTRNLVAAARAAGAPRFLAQSIAWRPPGRGEVVDDHEQHVLDAGGIVVRYGQLYGPGTFYEDQLPPPPRIHVDAAARDTVPLLEAESGVVVLAEDGSS